MPTNKLQLAWQSDAVTHCGKVRTHNEDAIAAHTDQGVWGVADGMGGHHAGDVASQSAAAALAQVQASSSLSTMITDCRNRLAAVNAALYQQSLQPGAKLSGCTVVVILASGAQGAVLWAGDSRAYQFRSGQFKQLTTDHSRVNELISSGHLLPEAAESHPEANVITRAVGVSATLDLEVRLFDIEPDELYLVCSDGLSRYVDDPTLSQLLSDQVVGAAAQPLLDAALASPARDNVSVIVMRPTQAPESQDNTALNPDPAWSPNDADDDPTVLDLGD